MELLKDLLAEMKVDDTFEEADELMEYVNYKNYWRVIKDLAERITENNGFWINPVEVVMNVIKEEAEEEIQSIKDVDITISYSNVYISCSDEVKENIKEELKNACFELSASTKLILKKLQII